MKEIVQVLREFGNLGEFERGPHMIKHGNFLITNAGIFPGITYSGVVIKADGLTLVGLVSMKDVSQEDYDVYDAFLKVCAGKMEKNYNDVDAVADGSATIIGQAGLNSSSDNTSRVGVPSDFSNLKYSFTRFPNQIKVEWESDEMSYGSILITTTDTSVSLVQTGPYQLKLTVGSSVIMIDVATKASAVVDHLVGGTVVKTSVVSFNTNGLNPFVTMKSVVVPI